MSGVNYYYVGIIILILLIIFYVKYIRNPSKSANSNSSNSKENLKRKNGKNNKKKPIKKPVDTEDDDDTESEDEPDNNETAKVDVKNDAERLYNNIHDRMTNGMKKEEFLEVAGDMVDKYIYIELKQLYNDAKSKGMDPSKAISAKDYAKVLSDANDDN